MVMEGDLTWGGEHTIRYTDDVIGLYTWKLYNFINQCHPKKFNKKEKGKKNPSTLVSGLKTLWLVLLFLKDFLFSHWQDGIWVKGKAHCSHGTGSRAFHSLCDPHWVHCSGLGTLCDWALCPGSSEVRLFPFGLVTLVAGPRHCVQWHLRQISPLHCFSAMLNAACVKKGPSC